MIRNIYFGLYPRLSAQASKIFVISSVFRVLGESFFFFLVFISPANFLSNIWSLTLVPGTELLNPLEFSGCWVSFVLRKRHLMGSWIFSEWVLVIRKTNPRVKTWNFQPYSSSSREGRGAAEWLCDEASIKNPELQSPESLNVVNILRC